MRYAVIAMGASTVFFGVGCGDGNDGHPENPEWPRTTDDQDAFEEVFEVTGEVALEETDDVIVVHPMVFGASGGSILLAEPAEGQVRRYSRQGKLRRSFGRTGEGPGEMGMPVSARETGKDEVVVADLMGRVVFFPEDGGVPGETYKVPVSSVFDAIPLVSGRYLLAGLEGQGARRLLHFWNRDSRELEKSFFPMPGAPEELAHSSRLAGISVQVVGDTIWAMYSLVDTVYAYAADGSGVGTVSIPLGHDLGVSGDDGQRGIEDLSVAQLFGLWLLGDGDIVVQIGWKRRAELTADLLIMNRDGIVESRLYDTPRLMLVDNDVFFFQNPTSILPNQWIVARRRDARGEQ
jgi:hypothetical protein